MEEPPVNFKPLTLLQKYLFCESYIRLLKAMLYAEKKEKLMLKDELEDLNNLLDQERLKTATLAKELSHLSKLFRKDKPLPKEYLNRI